MLDRTNLLNSALQTVVSDSLRSYLLYLVLYTKLGVHASECHMYDTTRRRLYCPYMAKDLYKIVGDCCDAPWTELAPGEWATWNWSTPVDHLSSAQCIIWSCCQKLPQEASSSWSWQPKYQNNSKNSLIKNYFAKCCLDFFQSMVRITLDSSLYPHWQQSPILEQVFRDFMYAASGENLMSIAWNPYTIPGLMLYQSHGYKCASLRCQRYKWLQLNCTAVNIRVQYPNAPQDQNSSSNMMLSRQLLDHQCSLQWWRAQLTTTWKHYLKNFTSVRYPW